METHGPLGTLWVGAGLSAFYIALIWLNVLLGHMLTPLFLLPATWFIGGRRRAEPAGAVPPDSVAETRREDTGFGRETRGRTT